MTVSKELKNNLQIQLERESYTPGDWVRGTITFNLNHEILLGCLVLKVNGNEKAMYQGGLDDGEIE